MMKKYKEYIVLGISIIIIVIVTAFPLFERGIGGDIWDLTYHLLRIESVKEALVNGSFPARVNPIYMDGYGYGSSMFYPDVFLIIPAVMNIVGISLLLTYKMFLVLITVIGTCTTYFSLRFVSRDSKCALVGSFVLMLCTYYMADVNNRAGISEYLACVFVPILVAGIYDYFACEGKRTYLLGIAFVGLALSHTIMTFIGVLVTITVFVIMLLVPKKRKLVFEWNRFRRLLLTALIALLSVSYYIWPMLEQMMDNRFWFNTPWAKVGDYVQTIESFFAPVGVFVYSAQFGVGIPVLVWLAGRVVFGKLQNKWADFFVVGGIALLLIMTDVVPWKLLEGTPLNMIQFTYRFYPYAMFFLVCGMTIAYAEKKQQGIVQRSALVTVLALAVVCGIWQNKYCYDFGARTAISKEYVYENNHWIGHGEWIPEGVLEEVFNGQGDCLVTAENGKKMTWNIVGYNDYEFSVEENNGLVYTVPLIYYKGYEADCEAENGERQALQVGKSRDGLVQIELKEAMDGKITVRYGGTLIQFISNIVSVVTIVGVGIGVVLRRRKIKK